MNRDEKLQDIKTNPKDHHHSFEDLQRCCFVDGALDGMLMEAHERYAAIGYNGGRACDTTSGPCSCGAWH
jgi:hypothetical protein